MLDDYVDKENPVRFIDAFIDSLNLEKLGFKHSILADTGRPSYDPSDLLKLYVYGYLNQVRSSRKLEKECHRNVEVMWLMKKLAPDFKTIADFRKNNVECIKGVFKEFVYLCKSLDLYGAQLIAIDGTKFKAVNSRSNNLNEKTVALRLKQTEERITQIPQRTGLQRCVRFRRRENRQRTMGSKKRYASWKRRKQQYEHIQGQMKATGQREVSLVDPDSRLMRVDSQRLEVGYNIQTSVDAKQHLIVDYDVINNSTDHHQLTKDALAAKQTLGVDEFDVLSDKGFYVEKDILTVRIMGLQFSCLFLLLLIRTRVWGFLNLSSTPTVLSTMQLRMCMFVLLEMRCLFGSGVIAGRVLRVGCTGRCVVLLVQQEVSALGINVDGTCSGANMMALLII